MSNVMSIKNLSNKVSRNGFDLSERRAFTGKVGEILPCFTLETLPGDSININPAHFTRTMPVNTAAYTQIKEYVHYYFVPYRLLHAGLDAFFSDLEKNPTRAESITSAMKTNENLPYLTYRSIATYINRMANKHSTNVAGMNHAKTACKLLEYLGYGDFTPFLTQEYDSDNSLQEYNEEQLAIINQRLSPLFLLAYQKVYQDHLRNKQWEKPSPQTCNMDYQSFGTELPIASLVPSQSGTLQNDMFSLRYCNHKEDYFFGLLPNAQYGDYARIPMEVTDYETGKVLEDPYNTNIPQRLSFSASVVALRKAEALQKYREIKQSGDQDYQSYLEKIFNVYVSDDRSDKSRYLGGYDGNIQISEVVNTNLTSDESIADIKGKGVSNSGGKNIHFEAKEHGVIIGLYMARPELSYALDAPIRANTRVTLDDFANPVFDRIGMESVPLSEIRSSYIMSTKPDMPVEDASIPLGYATRYASYKTNFDKVYGEFRNTLKAWVSPLSSETIFNGLYRETTSDRWAKYRLSYLSFKVLPNVVDSIFVQQADDNMSTDQLLINMGTGVPIVRNIDRDGLPY